MKQLLVINPNTSASVSALLQTHVQAVAGPHVRVRTVTARFGAPYIADEASYAVAAHAGLDAWAAALAAPEPPPDAILIGCFGDPGLMALRESSPAPVTGLAEAAFIEAARHGRYAIVTGGERWRPMLSRLAGALGHTQTLAGIHTVTPTTIQCSARWWCICSDKVPPGLTTMRLTWKRSPASTPWYPPAPSSPPIRPPPIGCWPRPAATLRTSWACKPLSSAAPGWPAWLPPFRAMCRSR